ncbi:MAG: DNA-binding protein [Spirochaetae bacterium HGW-Spirochaetae-8]|jgi:hemolysin III|nr:MAG: DNA-binding protein [Spirochaetae bacterium HGW-Spirochaetae-8]
MEAEEIKQTWLQKHISLHIYDDPVAEGENALTHGIGAILAVLFIITVLVLKDSFPTAKTALGMGIYGFTLLILYSSSTFYHILPRTDLKRIFRLLDHANIYILIAGTYTPIMLYIDSPRSKLILSIVWLVAFSGILFSLIFWGKLKPLHVGFYLAMGWMIVLFWNDIVPHIPTGLLGWVIAAGVTYSVGVVFYAIKRIPHYHAIWHVFCIAASAMFCIGFLQHLR